MTHLGMSTLTPYSLKPQKVLCCEEELQLPQSPYCLSQAGGDQSNCISAQSRLTGMRVL